MNIVFLGTPDFSVPALRSLHAAGHAISLVITRPDKPRGRGRKPSPTAVKRTALDLGLDIFQPESANSPEAMKRISETDADLGVVVAYGEILKPVLLNALPNGFINLHASLLPKYRGAAPIHWAIIRGDDQTGVTVQRIKRQLDTGPILRQKTVDIESNTTAGDLHDTLAEVGAQALVDVVNDLENGKIIHEQAQDDEKSTYAPKLKKSDGEVIWFQTAQQLARFVRGVTPWPGAHTTYHGETKSDTVILTDVEPSPGAKRDGDVGEVVDANADDGIVVQTGDGTITINRLKPANSRDMEAADFINGYRVKSGDTFE